MWESWLGSGRYSVLELIVTGALGLGFGVVAGYVLVAWRARGFWRLLRHLIIVMTLLVAVQPFELSPIYRPTDYSMNLYGPESQFLGLQLGLVASLPLWWVFRQRRPDPTAPSEFDRDDYLTLVLASVGLQALLAGMLISVEPFVIAVEPEIPHAQELSAALTWAATWIMLHLFGGLFSLLLVGAARGALKRSLGQDWALPSSRSGYLPYALEALPVVVALVLVIVFFHGSTAGGLGLSLILLGRRWWHSQKTKTRPLPAGN